jgi:hypothetical protein
MKIDARAKALPHWLKEGTHFGLLLLLLTSSPVEGQESEFRYSTIGGTVTIYFYTGNGGYVSIPETINGLPVTAISDNMTWGYWPIVEPSVVEIPGSVTNIGGVAFYDFSDLTSITVDPANPAYGSLDGVLFDKLQTTLFRFPTSGRSGQYQIPASVTNIGPDAFNACTGLCSVTIPDGVVSIERAPVGYDGQGAFSWCGLTNVTIPQSISSIPDYAFAGCPSLREVALPKGLKSIGSGAFWSCASLTAVYSKGNAPTVQWNSFWNDPATVYYLPGTTGWAAFATNAGVPTALWRLSNPQVLQSSVGVQSNQFAFTASWATNGSVVVEASTDLANPKWFAVATNSLSGGTVNFSDPQWTNYPSRVYRVRSPLR